MCTFYPNRQVHPRNYSQSTSSHLGLATGGHWVDGVDEIKTVGRFGEIRWSLEASTTIPGSFLDFWVCLKIGYIPNEIAIKNRDHDH
jgi:hypothetical protein